MTYCRNKRFLLTSIKIMQSREIKFRAIIWNDIFYFWLLDLIDEPTFLIREIVIPRLLNWNTPDRYTWLKDNNWVNIYECDIITHWDWMQPSVTNNQVKDTIVNFNDSEAKWDWVYPTLHPWRMCTVIWNIYQNPELLEK